MNKVKSPFSSLKRTSMARVKLDPDLETGTAPQRRKVKNQPVLLINSPPNVSKYDPKFVPVARVLASKGAIQAELARYELVPTGRTYYPPDVTAGIYWTKYRIRIDGVKSSSKRRRG
jgi:hypothetical protein